MPCPHCESPATTKRQGQTSLGSRRFRCQACRRRFNERTGTPFNDLQYPTDVVLLAVLRRLRYPLRFRDIAALRPPRPDSVASVDGRGHPFPTCNRTLVVLHARAQNIPPPKVHDGG